MIYGSTPLAYIIYKNHLNLINAKVNLSAVFFHSTLWLIILSVPFYLSYLASVQTNLEVSTFVLHEFEKDLSFVIFILLPIFLIYQLLKCMCCNKTNVKSNSETKKKNKTTTVTTKRNKTTAAGNTRKPTRAKSKGKKKKSNKKTD